LPQRTALKGGAHAYLSAPYGVYQTKDGYLALAMGNLLQLGEALRLDLASGYPDPFMWFDKRDEIISLIQSVIKTETTRKWLSVLEPLNIWCAEVLNYQEITQNEGYKVMGIAQQVEL